MIAVIIAVLALLIGWGSYHFMLSGGRWTALLVYVLLNAFLLAGIVSRFPSNGDFNERFGWTLMMIPMAFYALIVVLVALVRATVLVMDREH